MDRNGNGDIANGIASGSLSARRAWIEIIVANPFIKGSPVALRKESVDRNRSMPVAYRDAIVALRKESVDRNAAATPTPTAIIPSLSARRAWIEIGSPVSDCPSTVSLSARRAWIEIEVPEDQYTALSVALRKESVDRNY